MTARTDTKFKPGQSGNPEGRKPGSGKVGAMRAALEKDWKDIQAVLVKKAKEGDMQAIRIVAERMIPPLRAVESAVPVDLSGATLSEKGNAVLEAVAAGTLAPGQAAQILQGLGAMARVLETDELAKRIEALEAKSNGK
jgi:hypothetical protein